MRRIAQYVSSPSVAKKPRLVTIVKQEVYKDVELHSYKFGEAQAQDPAVANTVSADTTERLDGATVARFVSFREAQLRVMLQKYLDERERVKANDVLDLEGCFIYTLSLPESFNDATLNPLAQYMHRFLVWGALYDWYSQMGMQQAAVYGNELRSIENAINDILRTPSRAKTPLQPFGPAFRTY